MGYDFAVPNAKPGTCEKCRGTGAYSWGGYVNGVPRHTGTCFSCRGTGKQDETQIKRNVCYNKHKVIHL